MNSITSPKSFVSRGGLKLQQALEQFELDVQNLTILDVGSSTGGFVDCLLQNGATKVYSVDTAYGELAWKLRNDRRVIVMERTNILHLDELPEKVDVITIDASWTKLELILPAVNKFLKENGYIIALLKPHYEAGKEMLKKGILPDDQIERIKDKVLEKISNLNFDCSASTESPILGGGGNREFLLMIKSKI